MCIALQKMKRILILVACCCILLLSSSWGFFAHQCINRNAVFTLPEGMNGFYKRNVRYLTEHAVDPDKRRYMDTAEAPRHYLDVEAYEKNIDSIPRNWDDAVRRYSLPRLNANGILPWQIQRSYYRLVNAFKARDSARILISSAFLGHYIADAHVPLHTSQNHNGQLSNQVGIHAFWESRIPELFARKYNFFVGPAAYVSNPLKEAWRIVTRTHHLADTVLSTEAALNQSFAQDRKYSYSRRNSVVMKQYSVEYTKAWHDRMHHMVEHQMQQAILSVSSYWYTAWVDAGQPCLENMPQKKSSAAAQRAAAEEYKRLTRKFNEGEMTEREN